MSQDAVTAYDPRYLAGVLFFNAQDYFEAHEVWEELWHETVGPDRKFIQGLIQAAVALFHFSNGNVRGAERLYHSSTDYLRPYGPRHWSLDVEAFVQQMRTCFAELLGATGPPASARPRAELLPTISLEPSPQHWPDPESYLPDE